MVTASDITHFTKACLRKENDRVNRIREDCLLILNEKNHPFFSDEIYGSQWKALRQGFEDYIELHLAKIGNQNYILQGYTLEKKANLENHHDFVVSLQLQDETNCFVYEFKFNSMPQFVSIPDSIRYIPITLAEYWYDEGILDKIIALYPTLSYAKPSREEYLKGVKQLLANKSKDSFFKQFYTLEKQDAYKEGSEVYKKKLDICHEAIQTYLSLHGAKFDVETFKAKLLTDQPQKIYGVWLPTKQKFEWMQYTKEMLSPVKIKSVTHNTVVLETLDPNAEIHCLLRWRNYQGICNPAWQISMKRQTKTEI